jgi:hypothetical protein
MLFIRRFLACGRRVIRLQRTVNGRTLQNINHAPILSLPFSTKSLFYRYIPLGRDIVRIRHIITLAALASVSVILLGCPRPMPSFDGEVEAHRHRDTLIVDYDVVYGSMDPDVYDSITLSLYDSMPSDIIHESDNPTYTPSVVYPIDTMVTKNQTVREAPEYRLSGDLRLTGQLRYPISDGKKPEAYSFAVHLNPDRIHSRTGGSYVYEQTYSFKRQPGIGFILGAGMAIFDRSTLPPEIRDKAYKLGLDLQFGIFSVKDNFFSRISIAGSGYDNGDQPPDQYSVNEFIDYFDFRLGYEWRLLGGVRVAPVLGAKLSRLKAQVSGSKYDLQESRPSYGFQIGDNFNRIEYSYNPHFGGYHRLDYLACLSSGRKLKFGSMYSIYHGDKVKMLRVRFYVEAAGGRDPRVMYINDQPALQRIVSSGLLAPLSLVVWALMALGA